MLSALSIARSLRQGAVLSLLWLKNMQHIIHLFCFVSVLVNLLGYVFYPAHNSIMKVRVDK